jgi:glycosyltransferase involved in cell wall biosynthesis
MGLRLGFHYHVPMLQDEQGHLKTPGYLGRFLDSLAVHCDSLTCFMHTPRLDELPQMDYEIQSGNVEYVNLGPHTSVPQRMLRAGKITENLRQKRTALDAILLRGPSPLLPQMAQAAGDLPTALLIVGDYLAGVDDLPQPRWRKEAIRAWSFWNQRQQMAVSRKSLTFVNSRQLYEQFSSHVPLLYEIRTTTLSSTDFFERENTCLKEPFQLLYTGRMDAAKGLMQLVEAVDLLVQDGVDVVLNLVGWADPSDPILDRIMAYSLEHGIRERVIYHGYKSIGPELFNYYKMADIYLIASQNDFEGFPRTIWEAMAHSVPVLTTKVGSIPLFLAHEKTAWLLDKSDSRSIADGILHLIGDASLRQRLIEQARQVTRENTLENRALELYTQLTNWVSTYEKD